MVINKNEILVDGFDSETLIIYQFYRCKWHGRPCLRAANDKKECGDHRTMAIKNQIRGLGYNVVLVWECSHPELSTKQLNGEFIPYPHSIVYDFEVVLVKKDLSVTSDLMINSSHILISVAIYEEPIFLHNQEPAQLIEEFVVEFVRWQESIFDKVMKIYLMVDEDSLPSRVQSTWTIG